MEITATQMTSEIAIMLWEKNKYIQYRLACEKTKHIMRIVSLHPNGKGIYYSRIGGASPCEFAEFHQIIIIHVF